MGRWLPLWFPISTASSELSPAIVATTVQLKFNERNIKLFEQEMRGGGGEGRIWELKCGKFKIIVELCLW